MSNRHIAAVENAMHLQMQRLDGLKMIRLTDIQAEICRDPASEKLLAGGNRGMKSVTAASLVASIARDEPLRTADGEMVHCRLPHQMGRPLTIWCFGDHLQHIGNNIHRLLFRAGTFSMVQDEYTGAWRTWNPSMYPNDWSRENERKPAPPMIPERYIAEKSWYYKGGKQFKRFVLTNGTEICAFAASQDDPQGVPIDFAWIDENLLRSETYNEILMRLRDKRGCSLWSTIPRMECEAYMGLEERAASQVDEVEQGQRKPEDVYVRHYTLSLLDNPFIPEAEKQKAKEQIGTSETAAAIRIHGVSSTGLIRIYQSYDEHVHTAEYRVESLNDDVTYALRENNWVPPSDWTLEMILDPGTQKPAILFGAIPPERFWDHEEPYYVVWDEIYIPRQHAEQLAFRVQVKTRGMFFERFIIDGKAAQQTPLGFSHTVGQQYSKFWAEYGLTSRQTGSDFIPGDPSFIARSQLVHAAMRMRPCGRPQLRIINHKCPNLTKQLRTNTRKLDRMGEPLEEERPGQKNDVRVCLEYWMSRYPKYVEPPNMGVVDPPGLAAWKARRAERLSRQGGPKTNSVAIGVTG